ncbi:TonB-dependent receptor [Polaribacter atrinae]|uniref:SusC/RagA family TonB-linked outer membrane protein n=1 Tax=Polaribacter atrinae TaxID=1333662 RepID=UPI0030FC6410
MKKILFFICLFSFALANAQSKVVTGKVTDDNAVSIGGVSIMEKNTKKGVMTDFDGNYSISVSSENTILVFSYLGMKTFEQTVAGSNQINVTLKEDVSNLDEIVIIGYGTSKRKDVTGSVVSIKVEGSPAALMPTTNALQFLQGTAPGVNIGAISSAGGSPGLLVRGQNSISASNAPLIVLDGVIFDGSLNQIANGDIASIDVLKDASSAAIYGSRSANGVIIITTKRGKTEKPTINLNHYTGIQSWSRIPKMKSGEEFIKWRADNLSLTNVTDLSIENILSTKEYDAYQAGHQMDWLDEISQFAPIQNYQLSISGRTKSTNYYVSGTYLDQKGVLDGDEFTSFNLSSKIENKITDWLSFGLSTRYDSQDYTGFSPDINQATMYTPYSNKWIKGREDIVLDKFPTPSLLVNPYNNFYNDDLDKRWGLRGSGFVKIKVPGIEGLSFKSTYTQSRRVFDNGFFAHERSFVNPDVEDQLNNPQQFLNKTYGSKSNVTYNSWVFDNVLTYDKNFGDHKITALLGYTKDEFIRESVAFSGTDFEKAGSSDLGFYGLNLGNPERKGGSTSITEKRNVGQFARLYYNYKNKYHITGTYRRDGYSAFGEGNKFGEFPGVSVAWTASEEDFIKNNISQINYLKFRVSYGENGNLGISPYETQAGVNNGVTIFGDQTFNTIYQSSLGNKALSWETTTSLNLGLNFSLFNNRISGDIEYYNSKTTDQLLNRRLPPFTGFGEVRTNIGELENKGLEISLKTVNISSEDFKWSSGMTFWYNRNKLISLVGADVDKDGIPDDDIGNRWFIGESLSAIYDFTVDGIVQTEDTDYIATYGAKPGDLKIVDINGKDANGDLTGLPDGKINADDRSIIGDAAPNFRANISNTFNYKNFEFYFDINIVAGGGKDNRYLGSNKRAFLGSSQGNNHVANWVSGREYWMPDNQSNTVPRPNYNNPYGYGFYQSRGFLRLQNVSMAYNFDDSVKKLLRVNEFKVYVTGKNLFTKTDWVGLDPENAGQIASSSPVIRTFTLGLNLSF